MAVEKLTMMNMVGNRRDVDEVLKDVILFEDIEVVDAYTEIDNFRFTIDVTEEHLQEIVGFSAVCSGAHSIESRDFTDKLKLINEIFEDVMTFDKELLRGPIELDKVVSSVYTIYSAVHKRYEMLKLYKKDLAEIEKSIQAYQYFQGLEIPMEEINNLSHFEYYLGKLSKENVQRLKANYANVTAIVVHVGSQENDEVYVVITPKDMKTETERLLRSLNFAAIDGIKKEFKATPVEIIRWLEGKKEDFTDKIRKYEKQIETLKEQYAREGNFAYNVFLLYEKINEIKKEMAFTKDKFYFSGWVPVKEKKTVKTMLSKYEDLIVIFSDERPNSGGGSGGDGTKPPTKLKNNWLYKPFESIVKMYGMPSYQELDPTPFLSLSYLILFGLMFGDLGQGAVIFLAGFAINKKFEGFGSILSRMGLSSMAFGLFYGSLFGFEHIIPALGFRPFEAINTTLIFSILVGVVLITIGYFYGMINRYKGKDYYELWLGKHGLVGFLLYASMLLVALSLFTGNSALPQTMLFLLIGLSVLILFFEPQIKSKIWKIHRKREETEEEKGGAERFFDVFEVLLSIVTNTLSFIRVGAFALNHVGLFIAFETLAHMVQNAGGSFLILFIGNVFIIGLEGLIVGIQVLRLEYYELFSKYFSGGGIEFKPILINNQGGKK